MGGCKNEKVTNHAGSVNIYLHLFRTLCICRW
ncbi:MAG: DUF3797 domain-containing protein [Candidatus Thorarchaeota archaeon]